MFNNARVVVKSCLCGYLNHAHLEVNHAVWMLNHASLKVQSCLYWCISSSALRFLIRDKTYSTVERQAWEASTVMFTVEEEELPRRTECNPTSHGLVSRHHQSGHILESIVTSGGREHACLTEFAVAWRRHEGMRAEGIESLVAARRDHRQIRHEVSRQ